MTDLHVRFGAWLAQGAPGAPFRDLAIHASGCAECLAKAAALDALTSLDVAEAPMPPAHAATPARTRVVPRARAATSVVALGFLIVAVLASVDLLEGDVRPEPGAEDGATQPPVADGEGVLGEAGGRAVTDATAAPDPETPTRGPSSATPSPTPSPSAPVAAPPAMPRPPLVVPIGTPRPPTAPPGAKPSQGPGPTATPPAPSTPMSAAPTPSPSPSTPAPTPTPTPATPSPTMTPSPSPTPTPTSTDDGEADPLP